MSYNITGVDLDLADDRHYSDYIVRVALRDGKVWTLMLEESRIDRTLEQMRELKSSLEQQLGQAKLFQQGGDQDWRRRSTNLLRNVNLYLSDVMSEVKRLDREEYEETAAGERDRWKSVCGLLVDLMGDHAALGLITLPGDVTAAQWGALRLEKKMKAAA